MHAASFVETFVAEGDYAFQREIRAPSASISGHVSAADVEVRDKLCVGSVCVDTVAFGQMIRTSHSVAMQTLAMEVFMVNSMLGNTVLLPNQSVISLTYVGGDYARMVNSDSTGSLVANFATMVASAVKNAIGSASATSSFIESLAKNPVPSNIVGYYGIAGVTGEDVTNQVAAHLAVFNTWSSSVADSTSLSSSSTNPDTSVNVVSVTEGSIVVNLLITYPSS